MNLRRFGLLSHIPGKLILGILLVIPLFPAGCGSSSSFQPTPTSLGESASSREEVPAIPPADTVDIVMVGDNLVHLPVVYSGRKADGSYNFDHLFAHIRSYIQEADIAVINQETLLAGSEFGISEYPLFNSPREIGDAIAGAGFDVVQHANNHAMDRDAAALLATMAFWEQYPDIEITGVNQDASQAEEVRKVERNGIRVAFLSYTTSLNGLPLPPDMPWLVNTWSEDRVREGVNKAAREADFTIVLMHWGEEYTFQPSDKQREMASFLSENGADLVIGTHPHVLQPVEWIPRQDGGRTLVYYSLGNFISRQNRPERLLGGMARVRISREEGQRAAIESASVLPLVTHYEPGRWDTSYTVYPLNEYTGDLAAKNGINQPEYENNALIQKPPFTMELLRGLAEEVLGDFCQV